MYGSIGLCPSCNRPVFSDSNYSTVEFRNVHDVDPTIVIYVCGDCSRHVDKTSLREAIAMGLNG